MSLLKKVLLWSGGCLLLLVLAGSIGAYIVGRNHARESQRRAREQRSQRKLHVGDVPQTVRLRAGVPDTVDPKVARREEGWFYGPRGDDWNAVVVFNSLKRVDRIYLVGDYLWHPEDGLNPTEFASVDSTLQAFTRTLGIPCDTAAWGDSSQFRLLYPLSKEELNEDSAYQRWNDTSRRSVILRVLQVDLTKGRRVGYHGWAKASKGPCMRTTPR